MGLSASQIETLPDYPALRAFAQALWKEEAAIMVGAGFSRICAREPGTPIPPLWCDFASEMEHELGYEKKKGPDALRLAQEYQAQHGRYGLERLINTLVADQRWTPSKLHQQLMDLPWKDVLTTNWDTLLERTTPSNPARIYSCVRTLEDIASSRKPRIVKLHGSLPSYRPFILSEEDFRTYPSKFAPFVNLAQQVMLENELCLLGFSGNDPNFLAWSGWVRDTLNVAARQIRLVGVLNLQPAARLLLESRNVTPIDFAPLIDDKLPSDQKHEKAFELFFRALVEEKPASPYVWKRCEKQSSHWSSSDQKLKPTRCQIALEWKRERMSYPGWLILPVEELGRLRILPQETEGEIEESSDHLRFVLESIWRRKNGRIPANIQDLETADEHYENDSILFNQDDRIELCVNVASQWRLYKDWGKWSMWMNRLKAISTMEAQLWFSYENALRALLEWKDDLVLTNASRLKDGGPIWKMRRAGLLSALFRHQEAAELYENALKEIRMKLRADPVSPWLISLEGWADVSYRATHSSLANTHHGPYMPQDDEDRLRYMAAKADPWQIIFHLDKVATKKMIENREGPWKDRPSFYPGQICHELRFNSAEICPFYYVLEIMERTGAPARGVDFDLFSTRLLDGYLAMEDPDEHDLLTFLARYQGDSVRALDSILPRTRVARLSGEAVLMLIKSVMKRSEVLLSANERRRSDNHLNFLIALLGRVVVRADQQESIETVFQWGKNLLTSGVLHFDCLRKCGDMLKGCIGAMDTALRQKALEFALHHLLSGETDRKIHPMFWPEFIDLFTEEDVREIEVTSKLSDRIDSLIALVTNSEPRDRFRALNRLRVLHKADKLTECQNSDLEAAIWDGVGETEWPKHKYFLPWVFLDLPGHQRAEPVFKKRVLDPLAKGDFDAERLVNLQGGIGLLGREIGIEHIRDCIQKCIDWEPAPKTKQSDRLAQVQENPVEKEIGYALAQALLPLLKPDDVKGRIKETLHRIPELTYIPTISSTAFQFVRLCPELRKEGFSMLNQALASRDDARVFSSLFSVRSFLEHRPEEVSMLAELAEKMVVRLEQRIQPGLSSSIELVVEMTKLNCLSNDHKSRLANALTQIIEEYRYDQDRLPVRSMVDLPLVRRQIHRLVVRLAPEFSELVELVNLLKEDPLPEVRLCERPWQVPTID